MDSDDEFVILAALTYNRLKKRNKKRRRMWEHPLVTQRSSKGAFNTTFQEIRRDEVKFFNFLRMSQNSFSELFEILRENLTKQNTTMRNSLSAEEKLVITLR